VIDWAVAARPLSGQVSSGDLHVVKEFPGGVLLAAIDGIGHGQEARDAARTAGTVLESCAQEPVTALVRRCHDRLRGTRGVVMSVASFQVSQGVLAWVGVGDVQGVLIRRTPAQAPVEATLLRRAGVVGVQLPQLQADVLPVSLGDTLVFATDGVEAGFSRTSARQLAPQAAADGILARYGKATDDALVLVARYLRGRT